MSLDVSLVVGPGNDAPCAHCGMIGEREVYSATLTHNLGTMAQAAGLYAPLWRPDELYVYPKALMLIPALEHGLALLRTGRSSFLQYTPAHGCGTYDTLLSFVEAYLQACKQFPLARVEVSRSDLAQ